MAVAAQAKNPLADLNKTLAKLEEKMGKGTIHPASQSAPVYHLPFRNPHLNYATEGGAPWDRFVAMYGDESSGKTLAGLELVAHAQALPASAESILWPRIKYHRELGHIVIVDRLEDELEWIRETFPEGAECCWHDIEGQFDKLRAAKIGVDIDRMHLSEANVIENIGGILSGLYQHFHLHVLDSTSAATSLLSLKQEPGKSMIGTDARQWKNVLRDSQTYFGSTKNLTKIPNMVVMIHQMSTNVRSGGAQAMTTRYLKHTSSLSIKFSRGKYLWMIDGVLKDTKEEGADKAAMAGIAEADGIEVFIKIDKSRTCRPFRQGAMQFNHNKMVYEVIAELASAGLYHGVLEKRGTWYGVAGEEGNVGQGMKALYGRLADDEELRERIICKLMDISHEG